MLVKTCCCHSSLTAAAPVVDVDNAHLSLQLVFRTAQPLPLLLLLLLLLQHSVQEGPHIAVWQVVCFCKMLQISLCYVTLQTAQPCQKYTHSLITTWTNTTASVLQ
jgi:hypothetical protein